MRTLRRNWFPLLGLLLYFPSLATAQDLSLLVGVTESAVSPASGRAWQLEFRESLGRYLAVSGSYVNEGHIQGHKRDGLAGLVTLSAAYRFSEHWFTRFHWSRVFTSNNTDADLFLAGIGYKFRE